MSIWKNIMEFSLVCHAAWDAEKMRLEVFSFFLSSAAFEFPFFSSVSALDFWWLKPIVAPPLLHHQSKT